MPRLTSTQLARVSPRRRTASARARRRSSGQAAVEFSFTFILFLACLFGCISAALWSIESMATVSALENGLRVGASVTGPDSAALVSNAENDLTSATALRNGPTFTTIRNQLQTSLFGTVKIVPLHASSAACPALAPRTVYVCVDTSSYNPVHPGDIFPGTGIEIEIKGCAPSLVPFGFADCPSGVRINAYGTVPSLKFSK